MSELGDLFRDWKNFKRERGAHFEKKNLQELENMGVKIEVLSFHSHHYRVDGDIEYWPTTGRWRPKGMKVHQHFPFLKKFINKRRHEERLKSRCSQLCGTMYENKAHHPECPYSKND